MSNGIEILIRRFENAVHAEAMAEARDASYVTLRKKAEDTAIARQALISEYEHLQRDATTTTSK